MRPAPLPLVALLVLCAATSADATETRIYEHPTLEFRFTAPRGWQTRPHPEDDLIYEVADTDTGIHVMLWYTSTEQSARRYLKKMASMKDLVVDVEPRPRRIHQLDAWVLSVPGSIEGEPVHALLAVIPCGKSRAHPRENALYIVQIRCPVADFSEHALAMENILDSVRILTRVSHQGKSFPLYPETFDDRPDLPSPFTTADGLEFVVVRTKAGRFAILPVTVENGTPLDYGRGLWGQGRQLEQGGADFPALARIGLHAEAELDRTTTITGRPVAEITAEARPGHASGVGFLAADEDVLSVIRGDNRLVARLGLTHPQLAKPLFNVFNVTLRNLETYRRGETQVNDLRYLVWNDHRLFVDSYGSKGWQESLFDDDVLGYFELRMWRDLTPTEETYLHERYASLDPAQMTALKDKLTVIHTGEMVPFYVMRYGFYEGHTNYRADPIAIAAIFGLRSLAEIDSAIGGNLYDALTRHYTPAGLPAERPEQTE